MLRIALGLALLIALLAAATARADVVWLCMPGEQPNPCRDSLETTVYDESGGSRVENPPLPSDPPADCFYVYPTVSEQPSRNANKDKDAQVTAIARYQAARYSQVCKVYAPVYRQQTLGGLALGGAPEALQLAYSDVEEAWNEYLAKHNRGRPVVLISHSQGTRMLRTLIRRQIDGNPGVRERVVSAILLGGNVLVRKGRRAGGDFANVPACASEAETGCVIAWSTFNEEPPADSRYGRSPAEDTSGLAGPAGPEYEVLCTNPASLGANERKPLTSYLRGEPFPGVIGALLVRMYGGPQPTAPTPWLEPPDHYTGRCEQRAGANVLMLEPIGSARKLNPSPDATWGLHLGDANFAMGQLVSVTKRKIDAELATRARPRLTLALSYRRGRYGKRTCARGSFTASLQGADLRSVSHADYTIGKGAARRVSKSPFRATFGFGPPARGKVARIAADAALDDGRSRHLVRHVRLCR